MVGRNLIFVVPQHGAAALGWMWALGRAVSALRMLFCHGMGGVKVLWWSQSLLLTPWFIWRAENKASASGWAPAQLSQILHVALMLFRSLFMGFPAFLLGCFSFQSCWLFPCLISFPSSRELWWGAAGAGACQMAASAQRRPAGHFWQLLTSFLET